MQRLITTSQTILSIKKGDIPEDRHRDITYGWICCNYYSKKKDQYRTRITMGDNLINYPGNCGTPTADILTVKSLFNSIVSTPNAKFMTIDIKDFYLMTPMSRGKWLNCSACSLFCMQISFFCNVLPFCIWQNIFVRMVDIFHSIINEWA